MGTFVLPGASLGLASELDSGPGTHVKDGEVRSSLVGYARTVRDGTSKVAEVQHYRTKKAAATSMRCPIPSVGQVVTGRVSRITAGVVNVDIHCVGSSVLPTPAVGVIRVEDVFPPEVDHTAVQMTSCFRPGDVVKARIMSLGDARQYFLSTAEVRLLSAPIGLLPT